MIKNMEGGIGKAEENQKSCTDAFTSKKKESIFHLPPS
jgi:hypothetical protein